ncbi:MAG: hypothetical protein MHM6MM_003243 [Cercozoa sp. M6MM]
MLLAPVYSFAFSSFAQSAGSLPSDRLTILHADANEARRSTFAVGHGCQVSVVTAALPDISIDDLQLGRQGPLCSKQVPVPLSRVSVECVSVDASASTASETRHIHRREVQSISCVGNNGDRSVIASVDGCHKTVITVVDTRVEDEVEGDDSKPQQVSKKRRTQPLRTVVRDATVTDFGPARVCSMRDQNRLLTASTLSRIVTQVDVETHREIMCLHTAASAHAVTGLPSVSPDAFAVCEGNGVVSLWDVRSNRPQQRARVAMTPLYSIASVPSGIAMGGQSSVATFDFACAGADKVLYVMDARRLVTVSQARLGAKFDIVGLHFSPSNAVPVDINMQPLDDKDVFPLAYTVGMDSEIMCQRVGAKKKVRRQFGGCLRGDSRWVGMDVCSVKNKDRVVAITASGRVSVIDEAQQLAVRAPEQRDESTREALSHVRTCYQ